MFRFSNAILFACIAFVSVFSVFSFPADEEEGVSLGLPLNAGSTIPGGEPPVKETTVETTTNATNQVSTKTTSQPEVEPSSTSRPESSSNTSIETTSKVVNTKAPEAISESTGNDTSTTSATPKSSSTRAFVTVLVVFLPVLSIFV